MAISFAVLGSGSSGNSTVVTLNGATQPVHLLIDAGLSPRQTAKRLSPFGLSLEDISDVLVTHFDSDHFHAGWIAGMEKHGVTVHAHRRHRHQALRAIGSVRRVQFHEDGPELQRGVATAIESMLLAHDDVGTVGFVIEHDGTRLGYATDLGRVPKSLFERFTRLDALAFESNYDVQMQKSSRRPAFLKRRIMGGAGHLSNDQAMDAILEIASTSPLQHVALLHLSRQCNCPRLVQRLYSDRARHLLDRLTITNQYEPTPMLHVKLQRRAVAPVVERVGSQLPLFAQ